MQLPNTPNSSAATDVFNRPRPDNFVADFRRAGRLGLLAAHEVPRLGEKVARRCGRDPAEMLAAFEAGQIDRARSAVAEHLEGMRDPAKADPRALIETAAEAADLPPETLAEIVARAVPTAAKRPLVTWAEMALTDFQRIPAQMRAARDEAAQDATFLREIAIPALDRGRLDGTARERAALAAWRLLGTPLVQADTRLARLAANEGAAIAIAGHDPSIREIAALDRAERIETWENPLKLATLNGQPVEPAIDEIERADEAGDHERAARLRRERAGMGVPVASTPFALIDPATLAGLPLPPREWALDAWIPKGTTTLFTGAAGVGKSLMAQQLASCIAAGLPFIGIPTEQGRSLYLTCEDDAAELHRRQAAICEAVGVPLDAFGDRLRLASLIDADASLATFDRDNRLHPTQALARLRATIQATGATFAVLDNVAHLFAGNEIVKAHVAAFVGMLNRLASELRITILLIGHPNKAGAEFSGNVAWEAQVRARLFLDRIADDQGRIADPDARRLSRGKSNYAAQGETVEFRWHRWAFVGDADLDAAERAQVAARLVERADDEAFLACLDAATANRENVSHRPGSNYAPKIFAAMAEGKGRRPTAFERAMRRLVAAGEIAFDEELWPGSNRHPKRGIARAKGAPGVSLSH